MILSDLKKMKMHDPQPKFNPYVPFFSLDVLTSESELEEELKFERGQGQEVKEVHWDLPGYELNDQALIP